MWIILASLIAQLHATEVFVCDYKYRGDLACDLLSDKASTEKEKSYEDDDEYESKSKYNYDEDDSEEEESPLFK